MSKLTERSTMPYIFILPLAMMLLLTGCLESPKPTEHAKLAEYKNIETGCLQNPPQILSSECTQFVNSLKKERQVLDEMQSIKEDEKQESTYIALADQESSLALKLQTDRSLLAKKCDSAMSTIVDNDDINSASFCLLFDENSIALKEYKYLQKNAPIFDNNPQYRAYKKLYAQKKLHEGINAMNKGDKRTALTAFKAASEANSAEATYLVGIIYEAKQIKKAIAWHKQALAEGVNLSKLNLARLYLRIKLPHKAKEWYLNAAEDDNALAQYQVFKMDAKSKSFKAYEKAQASLLLSAENNYPQAQYILGLQLLKQKKTDQAQQWLEKAEANGISGANLFLGKLYFEQKLYPKAYSLLLKSADTGAANYMLGQMYEKALGVKKNSILAYRHYKKAHELAHDNHVDDMKRMQKKLTKKERKEAKYIARKEAAKAKDFAKNCGVPYSSKNIKVTNRKIHLHGVGIKPIKEANGFIIYGEQERLYYVVDAKIAATLQPYTPINIMAKTTGHSILISSDTGRLQDIAQFQYIKECKAH